MRGARTVLFFVLPLAAAAVLGTLAGVGAFRGLDGRVYDRQLSLRPGAPVPGGLLLVDIDAMPGSLAGLLADGLVTFKEMGARTAVLDLPLAQKSPPSLDPTVLRQTLPNALDTEFSQVEENIQSLFDAIRRGSVRPRDAARYVADLVNLVGQAKGRLLGAAMGIERDDDVRLGQAAAFFGRVYVPLEPLAEADPTISPDLVELALQRQGLSVLVRGRDPTAPAAGLRPAVQPVVNAARGGGFPSDGADPDGVRRRTRLLRESGGQHIGQLAFAAALDLLGGPSIEAVPGEVILRSAWLPGKPAATITIPLTESGAMLLDWPRAASGDGFRHLAWSDIVLARHLEDSLVGDLRDLDSHGYLTYLRSAQTPLDVYEDAARLGRGMLAAGADTDVDQWRDARQRFFALCDQYFAGDAESRIIADADRQLRSGTLSDDEKNAVRVERDRVPGVFSDARDIFGRLQALRGSLRQALDGSFCIVSLEAGAGSETAAAPGPETPFGTRATDARASAALVATLLSGRFLREASSAAALLTAAVLSLLAAVVLLRPRPLASLLAGSAAALVAAAGLGALFVLTGLFVAPTLPVASILVTAAVLSSVKLGWKRADSRTVRAAFAGRVSAESLQIIDSTREKLAVDGGRRSVTVLCLAEDLPARGPAGDPREVVRRLRTHREAVGEAVAGLGGMLLESGSRVMAAFGAPVENADHARRACLAALRARALEQELNGGTAPEFSSRIGIHSGDGVTGFLGPGGLAVFGVVGSTPEVAARLESLNETLGTSILLTEQVRREAGDGFLVRRVATAAVGRQESLRVYELLAERDAPGAPGTPGTMPADALSEFEAALARFENGEVAPAARMFQQVLAKAPGDGPSMAYIRRCRRILEGPGRPDPLGA